MRIMKQITAMFIAVAMLLGGVPNYAMAAGLEEETSQEISSAEEETANETVPMNTENENEEEEEILVEDLDGLLLPERSEEDANSWRYQNGERIECDPGIALASEDEVSKDASDAAAFGIDVSKHNGEIDWDLVSEEIDFAIIRCGYGSNKLEYDDEYFLRNVQACERLGIPYGVYLYSYATNTTWAASEAQHVLRLLKGLSPDLPVYYDLEDNSIARECNAKEILEIAQLFCGTVQAAGYEVGIYANLDWWNTRLTSSTYDSWDRWVAQWGSACTYDGEYTLWQYTDGGTLPGIFGVVDFDYAMKALPGSEADDLIYVNNKLYTGYYLSSDGRMYNVKNGEGTLKSGTLGAGTNYYSNKDGKNMTLARTIVYVNGSVYTGYYTDSTGKMYKVGNGTRALKNGTLGADTRYYSYNDAAFQTLAQSIVYVRGLAYSGYYMDSTNKMYKVVNGNRSLKNGTLGVGTEYYSYNEGAVRTLAEQIVYVGGLRHNGHYKDSAGKMYKVVNGKRSLKRGTLGAGTEYYSYNDAATLKLEKAIVYVSGLPYSGYYTDSAGRMSKVVNGARSLKNGTLGAGTAYYSYNDAAIMKLTRQIVYVDGKAYSGHYTDSTGKIYKVVNGTRSLKRGTLAAGTTYYSYNDAATKTLSRDTVYVGGLAYSGYYTDSTGKMYKVVNGSRTLFSGTLLAGTSYYSYNANARLTLGKRTVFVKGR